MYNILTEIQTAPLPESRNKWRGRVPNWDQYNEEKWHRIYMIPHQCTKETKLRALQYKILHSSVATNSQLHRIGFVQSDLCTFCQRERETIDHLFVQCTHINILWTDLQSWLSRNLQRPDNQINFSSEDIFFGRLNYDELINNIILLTKHYIAYMPVNSMDQSQMLLEK